ncbi:hypothetical protein D1O30_15515 [Methylocystis hirsuta]|uniref:Uncharacterized protein n=1 Tax=Methylocystis hirsuta TaxID=369798 RepID=A0A3M9XSG6_9HYPH|nr:hypothetical protein D1O30_15515 [Methylocystis hirsuta]
MPALTASSLRGCCGRPRRFPIAWNCVIDKKSLKIKLLEQVLIEKVCQLFRNLLQARAAARGANSFTTCS